MSDPILGPGFTVPLRALDIDLLIVGIEVGVPDGSSLLRDLVVDADFLEEWRADEIHVLPWDGPETHHGQHGEGAHCATVVIARDAIDGGVELRWDIGVAAVGGEARAAGVVVLPDREESLLIADVEDSRVVEVVEALIEFLGAAESGDQ